MESAVDPGGLLEAFLTYGDVKSLDLETKSALRLCNKHIKSFVDQTPVAVKIEPGDLKEVLRSNWRLGQLKISREAFHLTRKHQKQLGALFRKQPFLEKLNFQGCRTLDLPETIGQLAQLKVFSAYNVKALPVSFGQLSALEHLNLAWGSREIPFTGIEALQHFKNLKTLRLSGYPVRNPSLPEWICSNVSTTLESLSLDDEHEGRVDHNAKYVVPAEISNFPHLSYLCIRSKRDVEAPDSLGLLCRLHRLVLFSNRHNVALPNSISRLGSTLRDLMLSTEWENIEAIRHLTGLTQLHLVIKQQGFSDEISHSLSNLTSLKVFTVHGWNARLLPVGNLTALETLNIYSARSLKSLPESIGNLKLLKSLVVRECGQLETLPESIDRLKSLQVLIVYYCDHFMTLPDSFADLIFNKNVDEWSLREVSFDFCPNLQLSRTTWLALQLLHAYGIYKKEGEEDEEDEDSDVEEEEDNYN